MTQSHVWPPIGRDAELQRLRDVVTGLSHGQGRVVWIDGEPGIGKSMLVEAGLVNSAALGIRLFRAVGDELTPAFALRFLADGLAVDRSDGFRAEIADLLAGRGSGLDAVLAAGDRMMALIERECARSPVVLFGDDVQWADEASLALWYRLAAVSEQVPLLLIAACRPVPQRPIVDRLRHATTRLPGGVLIELEPLADDAVAEMAGRLLRAAPGPHLRGLLTTAGGNPLYVREMIDALIAGGDLSTVDGTADLRGPLGSQLTSLGATIGRRLGYLSAETRTALRTGAVLGARFTLAELARFSARTVPDLAAPVEEAMRAGVLTDGGSELTFRHPLIRQVLHDEVSAPVRAGMHGHAAKELADAKASWDRVAQHLLAAPETIDGWALDWLMGIPPGQLLAQPAIAADLLEYGRQATMPGDPRRGAFTARLTAALRLLRRPDALITLGSEALGTITEPAFVGEIAWNLARGYQMIPGRGHEGIAVIDRVLDPGIPWRTRLHAQRALLLATTGRGAESVPAAEAAIQAGERDKDPVSIGWALIALLQVASGIDALDVVERGLAVISGDDPESVDLKLLFLANQLVVLSDLNRTDEFEAVLPTTIALAEHLGTPRITEIQLGAAHHFRKRGDWDNALLYVGQVEARSPYQALSKHGMAALIYVHQGDLATAASHLAAVADIPYTSGLDYMIAAENLIVARAMVTEVEGDTNLAIKTLSAWLDPRVEESAHARSVRAEALRELVRLALESGDRAIAETAAAALIDDARINADAEPMLVARFCRGMVDGNSAPLLEAAEHYDTNGQPLEAAFAAEQAAVLLAEHGETQNARDAFGRAARMYEQLGATLDLRRAQTRLSAYGIRGEPSRSSRRAATGWEALTPAERVVARLVAEGRSNPDIAGQLHLSRRTVEAHVTHILHKLQVRSRVEINQEVRRYGTTSG